MIRPLLALGLLALAAAPTATAQQTTGLSGYSLFLDPGHSGTENQGAFGYSESEGVLLTSIALRDILATYTDIDTVLTSRFSLLQQVGLQQRVDLANASGADFFHSIHTNAAGPDARSVFVLWPQRPDLAEPTPAGGRAMAEATGALLAEKMEVPASNGGAWGECAFYGPGSCRSEAVSPKASRNFVQGYTTMPSMLSESGFHTNPGLNLLFMDPDYQRLKAWAMAHALLDVRAVDRPDVRLVGGVVTDAESGLPINGAVALLGDQTDVTPTFATLFEQHLGDSVRQVGNGFYWFEDVGEGEQQLVIAREDYEGTTVAFTPLDRAITRVNATMVSTVPAFVAAFAPGDEARVIDPIVIDFSRPMDRDATQAALSFSPAIEADFIWSNGDRRLLVRPDTLAPLTAYTVTVDAGADGARGYGFDGNADGQAGDAFTATFTTGPEDVSPPRIVAVSPANNAPAAPREPLVQIAFDEALDPASLDLSALAFEDPDGGRVAARAQLHTVGERSALNAVPVAPLRAGVFYRFVLPEGITDQVGNPTGRLTLRFTTAEETRTFETIDAFEGDVLDRWWQPTQSGSTTTAALIVDSTEAVVSTLVSPRTDGSGSLAVRYGWVAGASSPFLIRQYVAASAPSRQVRFAPEATVSVSLFGDGSGNLFRFAVDDDESGLNRLEVSPWTTVDWIGWRTVEWTPSEDGVGSWVGNGTFVGNLNVESLQLSRPDGEAVAFGRFVFDDLRVSTSVVTSEDPVASAGGDALRMVRPHPVREQGDVAFELAAAGPAELVLYDAVGRQVARLAGGVLAAGPHLRTLDASNLPSGVYLLRLSTQAGTQTRQVVVVR